MALEDRAVLLLQSHRLVQNNTAAPGLPAHLRVWCLTAQQADGARSGKYEEEYQWVT
jgi:hypothetical protein